MKNYLALDIGATSGRGILGQYDGSRVTLTEIHRYGNYFVPISGKSYWDMVGLHHENLIAVEKASAQLGGEGLTSFGVDTWGTDYGLLDCSGQPLANIVCMRDTDATGLREFGKVIPRRELFNMTGSQFFPGKTLFQLYERVITGDAALQNASTLLMLPDLLAYFFTGQRVSEYTITSTSMLYDYANKGWHTALIDALPVPRSLFTPILLPAADRFPVLPAVREYVGGTAAWCVPVGGHDTASAVAATPLQNGEAFCSSGTWTIMGVEADAANFSSDVYRHNFSNEGTVQGGTRLQKDMVGMWVIQQIVNGWNKSPHQYGWDEVMALANEARPFRSMVDLESPEFYFAGDMEEKVRNYCQKTAQPLPETKGEMARCVYESMAMRYRMNFELLEKLSGRRIPALRIVGGGAQNSLMNQFVANAIQRPVYAGPIEAASIGNILMQAVADGEIADVGELRQVVLRSFEVKEFSPQAPLWDEAYQKYQQIVAGEDISI